MSATPESPPEPNLVRCCVCGETSEDASVFTDISVARERVRKLRCPLCTAVKDERYSRGVIELAGLALVVGGVGGVFVDPRLWTVFNFASIYFMAWLCVLPHEAGHALMARLMGMRVLLVSVGIGSRLVNFRLRGVPVEIRALPVSGYVLSSLDVQIAPRLRYWLVVLAGPAVNALLLLTGMALLSWLDRGYDFGGAPAPLVAFVFGNVILLLASLAPVSESKAPGQFSSDGYKLLTLPFTSRAAMEQARSVSRLTEGAFLVNAGRFEEAARKYDAIAADSPFADGAIAGRSHLLVCARRFDEAEALLRAQLDRAVLPVQIRAIFENNLAWSLFSRGDAASLAEADAISAAALGRMPWEPAIRSTRGVILVERGQAGEGLRLLSHRANSELAGGDAAITLAMKAYAYYQLGRTAEAADHLRRAERAGADDPVVARVRARIPGGTPAEAA